MSNQNAAKLIVLYPSPWSERVRWAFKYKGASYDKQDYQPGGGEEDLKRLSGQKQVPVLMLDDRIIPDSTAILDWLDERYPVPALRPKSPEELAEVMHWEELMDWVLGPQARLVTVGRLLHAGDPQLQQIGRFIGQKYGYSAYAESHANSALWRVLNILKYGLAGRDYLVGGRFSRADLTVASMLGAVNPAPDDLFVLPEPFRSMFTLSVATQPEFATVFQWRDDIYRKHRGETVTP